MASEAYRVGEAVVTRFQTDRQPANLGVVRRDLLLDLELEQGVAVISSRQLVEDSIQVPSL